MYPALFVFFYFFVNKQMWPEVKYTSVGTGAQIGSDY